MAWKKLGMVFDLSQHKLDWIKSHAMLPTPLVLEDRIRVYYSPRTQEGKSCVTFVDVALDDPAKILYVHQTPVLAPGKLGACDDSGTLCTSIVRHDDALYMYYTAYNIKKTVPYGNSIGLAISEDGGMTFSRPFDGPVLDRLKHDPYFVISPCVIQDNDIWHMWYASGSQWIVVDDRPESVYHIKYAYSKNGIDWSRDFVSCIIPNSIHEANARPTVFRHNDRFEMLFCYRGSHDFRDGPESYRIGYASATSPTNWTRDDARAGIVPGPEPYDSLMQAYPAVVNAGGKRYLFYNGNGFGVNGFCCAESDE